MRILKTLILLCCTVFLSGTIVVAEQSDPLINGIALFDSKERLLKVLGPPDDITHGGHEFMRNFCYQVEPRPDNNGRSSITFSVNLTLNLVDGITGDTVSIPGVGQFGPGSTKTEIEQALGPPTKGGVHLYTFGRTALNFRFDRNDKLVAIWAS